MFAGQIVDIDELNSTFGNPSEWSSLSDGDNLSAMLAIDGIEMPTADEPLPGQVLTAEAVNGWAA